MTTVSSNCIVCAAEFDASELQDVVASSINSSNFKICQTCLDACDPADDYRQARDIVNSYLKFSEVKQLFSEASDILKDLNKK
ncbi:hypothetical protein A3K80_06720 [Candidatus Bathyarchaeota archaeon RBG_13_38_9]|nr:MAG: hypothetical protein A3K80_06720 [Candidatus Bathyarchaeota archaeon RBG_13_38_9]